MLIPPKSLQQRLKDESKSMKAVLEQVKYRAEWQKYQEQQKAREEEILERERGTYIHQNATNIIFIKTHLGFYNNIPKNAS